MFIVYYDPGHVGVCWVKFISGDRDVVHQFVSLWAVDTGIDDIPIHIVLRCASLSLGDEVSGILF